MATRNLLIVGSLLMAASAFARPPPGADMTLAPWFHSLRVPGGTHYQVLFDSRWLVVPTEAV